MSLRACEYLVFDEADRLFEMGFADQLKEVRACCRACAAGGAAAVPLRRVGGRLPFPPAAAPPATSRRLPPRPRPCRRRQILSHVGPARQTLLFSATMPKALAEFARAGLKDPELVRLDADTKISPDLSLAFFTMRCAGCAAAALDVMAAVSGLSLDSSAAAAAT